MNESRTWAHIIEKETEDKQSWQEIMKGNKCFDGDRQRER